MKTNFKVLSKILVLVLLTVAIACSKDGSETDPTDPTNPPIGTTLAEVVANGDAFENFPPNITETEVAGSETTGDEDFNRKDSTNLDNTIEQRWICTEKEVDITGGSHTFPLYNPNASVIWPGNLLQGKTLGDATPRDIVVKRAAGTITYDLVNGNQTATRSVDVIDQGSVQQAMNDIIAGSGDAPARFALDVVAINSKEQLAVEMGLSVSNFTTKVSSDFSYNSSSDISSVLVKLTQQYYTMSYVKPTSLDEVFDSSVTPEQLATFVQPDNPASFISSVTYGRIFYMLYESSASAQDMEATLRGSYNAVAGKASAEVSINKLREYNNLKVKVIAYGGDSEGTLEAVGSVFAGDEAVDNLKDIVDRLALAGNIETGLPLSYVVNSLEDPSQVVSTNLATSYTVKTCELKGVKPPAAYADFDDLFEDGIGAMLNISSGGIHVLIFNKAGDRYAWYNGTLSGVYKSGSGDTAQPIIFAVNEESNTGLPLGPLGNVPVGSVGAAVDYSPSIVFIFNNDGLEFNIADVDLNAIPANGLPTGQIVTHRDPQPLNSWFGGPNYLLTNGFGAAVNVGNPTMAYFEKDKEFYQIYRRDTDWNSGKLESKMWYDDDFPDEGPQQFEKVGAATRFAVSQGGSDRYLFVNQAGDEIMQWFSSGEPGKDRFEGPWVITKD